MGVFMGQGATSFFLIIIINIYIALYHALFKDERIEMLEFEVKKLHIM